MVLPSPSFLTLALPALATVSGSLERVAVFGGVRSRNSSGQSLLWLVDVSGDSFGGRSSGRGGSCRLPVVLQTAGG